MIQQLSRELCKATSFPESLPDIAISENQKKLSSKWGIPRERRGLGVKEQLMVHVQSNTGNFRSDSDKC
jgi:hypothetical protein